MKKVISLVMALVLLLCGTGAFAADMGVQIIGGPETETEPVSLDDIQIGAQAEIPEYALINPLEFSWEDELPYINVGVVQSKFKSGLDAEYACLKMDITNTMFEGKDFLQNSSIKVIYDDAYEYSGWIYQYNYQTSTTQVLSDENDTFSIDPLYVGHYAFGCTLPNLIVESDKPLRMVIMLDGNEITYNIRK